MTILAILFWLQAPHPVIKVKIKGQHLQTLAKTAKGNAKILLFRTSLSMWDKYAFEFLQLRE